MLMTGRTAINKNGLNWMKALNRGIKTIFKSIRAISLKIISRTSMK